MHKYEIHNELKFSTYISVGMAHGSIERRPRVEENE